MTNQELIARAAADVVAAAVEDVIDFGHRAAGAKGRGMHGIAVVVTYNREGKMIEDSEIANARRWRPPAKETGLGAVGLPEWRVTGWWRDDDEFFIAFIPAVDEGSAIAEAYRRHDPLQRSLEITGVER